ncbi:MAG: DUF924 family protein [Candidatus Binataceae bacterium]
MSRVDEILDFWFGRDCRREFATRSRLWFEPRSEFDRQCTWRFLGDCHQAASGLLDEWRGEARSCLALILLLDQLPRNIFRNQPRAFATDSYALAVAKDALRRAIDRRVELPERLFFYLPLEHSENLFDQRQSVELAQTAAVEYPPAADFVKHAREHLATIERFGRFLHRNAILGRASTPEEITFLKNSPG